MTPTTSSRRTFLSTAAAGATALLAAPAVATSSRTNAEVIIGEGEEICKCMAREICDVFIVQR